MTVDPADASVADVRRALQHKFRTCHPDANPTDVAMSIAGPVIEAQARLIAKLRGDPGHCILCYQPVRPVLPGDGLDPRDYRWTHEDGNPICPITPEATPGGAGVEGSAT